MQAGSVYASVCTACNKVRFIRQLVPEGMTAPCRNSIQILGCDPEIECFAGGASGRLGQIGRS